MPPIVLTCGDPAGVGSQIAAQMRNVVVIGCATQLRHYGANVHVVQSLREKAPKHTLPVLHVPLNAPWQAGVPTLAGAHHAWRCMQLAVDVCLSGDAAAMVTGSVHKATLYSAGFTFAGQTEFLTSATRSQTPAVMMLVGKTLRVVPVTVHVSLAQACAMLSREMIVYKAIATHNALQQYFGIAAPRLAVAALNPHAGEYGTMGTEEQTIIQPAIEELRAQGLHVSNPLPCDTLFHAYARRSYDAVLCMYHDQALLPLKTLYFDCGVNVSLNLPIIRTSPDHGTAFDIAGTDNVCVRATQSAITLARQMAKVRATAR